MSRKKLTRLLDEYEEAAAAWRFALDHNKDRCRYSEFQADDAVIAAEAEKQKRRRALTAALLETDTRA